MANIWKNYVNADRTYLTYGNVHKNKPAFKGTSEHKIILVAPDSANNKRFNISVRINNFDKLKTYARALGKTGLTENVEVSEGVFEEWYIWEGFMGSDISNYVQNFNVTDVYLSYQDEEYREFSNPNNKVYKGEGIYSRGKWQENL